MVDQSSRRGPWASELRATLWIALPVVIVQVGGVLMGFVDTLMVGHVSAEALAAVALGHVYFFAVIVFGMGLITALDPVVAQAVGAGDAAAVARAVQRGLIISAVMSVPATLLLIPGEWILRLLHQSEAVIPVAAGYARISIWGVLPFFAFLALRQSLQAMHRLAPIVVTIVIANLVNVALNWVLIFGHLGAPAMGPLGSAWASSVSRTLMALALLALAWGALREQLVPLRREALRFRPFVRMIRLGTPLGLQTVVEYGAFSVIALLMGWIGPTQMAAHQIALQLAALTFMVPLGFSAAAAVRVGYAVGRQDPPGARRAAAMSILCGTGFMTLTAALFLIRPGPLARRFTDDPAVWGLAASLIPIAGFFQVFDGLQAVSTGVLRGMGDTRSPMVIHLLGLWLIGLPVSLHLAFRAGHGARGLWWGFVAGLGSVALILLARVRFRMRREMPRVVIDDEPAGA